MTNHTLGDPKLVIEALQEVRPTVMCAVPRFYEKIYAAVYKKLQGASLFRRILFHWAVKVGSRAGILKKDGLRLPPVLRLQQPDHPGHRSAAGTRSGVIRDKDEKGALW